MAAAATAILAAGAFIGSGYLHTRRVEHKAQRERAAVHAMTQQELAAAIARCDAMPAADTPHDAAAGRDAGQQRDSTERRDAAYCEEAAREMDDRPLEIVDHTLPGPMPPAPMPTAPRQP
jgi:hypothetical protein